MERNALDLEWVWEYEVEQARRHRRFVSLAMLKSKGHTRVRQFLTDSMRQSDVYFEFGDSLGAIMMGETDRTGARAAIQRFMDTYDGEADMRFAIASFPEDNLASPSFLPTVYSRLRKAEDSDPGTVVFTDG